jgi:hypothetical protein
VTLGVQALQVNLKHVNKTRLISKQIPNIEPAFLFILKL